MIIKGKTHKYGDNVNTDEIIPAQYLNTIDPNVLGRHCMAGIDGAFAGKVKPGDILVAGWNFGCGSSREHAPVSIKGTGVAAVIAASFARIFYRNSINIGLPILECPQAAAIVTGDVLEIDLSGGLIRNITQNTTYQAGAFPPFLQQVC